MANPAERNRQYDAGRAEARRVHGDRHVDKILRANQHHPLKARRKGDYRLDPQQRRALVNDGITLVDTKIRAFGEAYNDLYEDDMPVFVTADSVLHAWHVSFDAFFMDMEITSLQPLLELVLTQSLEHAQALYAANKSDALLQPLLCDIVDYLTVAVSLNQGKVHPQASKRVATVWQAIQSKQPTTPLELFGARRVLDMSMLEPRGHYAKSYTLSKYFQAVMWLALVDLRLDDASQLYQLQAACCLMHVLRDANVVDALAAYEATLDALVGSGYGPDALTPRAFDKILPRDAFGLSNLSDPVWCGAIQHKIQTSGAGFQAVNAQIRVENESSDATTLPLAFAFVGQYAAWDAFALSRLVFDRVRHHDTKVVRSLPSAVDVAFTVMGNDAASHIIAKRMTMAPNDSNFVRFRDGLPYASNLMALRQVLDQEIASVDLNTCSLTTLWTLVLRALSRPPEHEGNALRTETWKRRVLNTQIGSYMQLKHDTILTAKQPMSFLGGCSHPAAFVDPYPAFWATMAQLATRAVAIVREMNEAATRFPGLEVPNTDPMAESFFTNFATVMQTLETVALAQARHQELSQEQDEFLKAVMEGHLSSGPSQFKGWYPSLFFKSVSKSVSMENQVIDIFTNPPSPARDDPGGVLHLHVSHAELCAIVVDDTMYAGPIYRHGEFVAPAGQRFATGVAVPTAMLKRPEWFRDSFASALQ